MKLFNEVKQWKVIMRTISSLMKPFSSLVLVSFILFLCFALIGDRAFGGLKANHPKIVKNQSIPDTYTEMNFNDILNSFVTLFTLMVVNNWYIIVDMFVAVTGTIWARLFFVVFYFLSVLVVLNILVAFSIDMYSSIESIHSEKSNERNKKSTGFSSRDTLLLSNYSSQLEVKIEKNMEIFEPDSSEDLSDDDSQGKFLSFSVV